MITLPKALAPFSTATLENLAATQTAITTPKNNVAFAPLEVQKAHPYFSFHNLLLCMLLNNN